MQKRKRKIDKKSIPFFGSGILTDSIRSTEERKFNATGIFTILYAWSFPCNRTLNAVITIFNLPKGVTSVAASVAKRNSRNLKSLSLFDVSSKTNRGNITIPYLIKHKFEHEGFNEIIFSFRDYPGKLKIPLDIHKKEWPNFSEKELEFVKKRGEKFPSFRVTIHCSGCEHAYIFEEILNPIILPKGGVYRFPEESIFICEECEREMDLRDIRGQLRQSLKDTIILGMKGNS